MSSALELPSGLDPALVRRLSRLKLVLFDFDGVFTDNMVFVDQNGVESVRCCRSDGLGLSRLKAAGVAAMIVSTEANPVVSARARKLTLPVEQAVADKSEAAPRLAAAHGVAIGETAFVGNDINDLGAMAACGLAIAVADAWPEALAAADLTTRRRGGEGAVREVCDLVVAAKMRAAG